MYEWIKVAHLISVISWMVGLLYLPRLMVYHSSSSVGSEMSETFKIMERRLLKGIMTPAMLSSWFFGLLLAYLSGLWVEIWFVAKFLFVVLLSIFHMVSAGWVKRFAIDNNVHSAKFFRIANEVPTIFMILVVILVVIKPF